MAVAASPISRSAGPNKQNSDSRVDGFVHGVDSGMSDLAESVLKLYGEDGQRQIALVEPVVQHLHRSATSTELRAPCSLTFPAACVDESTLCTPQIHRFEVVEEAKLCQQACSMALLLEKFDAGLQRSNRGSGFHSRIFRLKQAEDPAENSWRGKNSAVLEQIRRTIEAAIAVVGIPTEGSQSLLLHSILAVEGATVLPQRVERKRKRTIDPVFSAPSPKPAAELHCWFNVLNTNDWNVFHDHAAEDALLSGVLWLDVAEPQRSGSYEGALVVQVGSHAVASEIQETAGQLSVSHCSVIQPKRGTLLLWPAWLPHAVLPHVGCSPRISLAFNVSRKQ